MGQARADVKHVQLYDSIRSGNTTLFNRLVEDKFDFNKQQGGTTAIHQSIHFHRTPFLEALLTKGANPNVYDSNGRTPLHWACAGGQLTAVTLLLSAGGKINIQSVPEGRTALHFACEGAGHVEVVRMLLHHGAAPNAPDKLGVTPLHVAMSNPHTDITSLLLQHRANPNAVDSRGCTALHYAGEHLDMAKVLLLVENRAVVHLPDPTTGSTLLHWASELDDPETINRVLARHSVPLNVKDKNEATPLHLAAFNGHLEACLLLLAKGADPTMTDKWNNMASDHAEREGHVEIAAALKNAEKIWRDAHPDT